MNDEEKKAIEELKKVRWNSLAIVVKNEDGKMDISYFTEKHKKTILNLIEKQSKEIVELIQRNKDLEEIEKEHKEENGRLREKVKKYETMIINHKKQLSKSGIYGYDYDLKILEESEK